MIKSILEFIALVIMAIIGVMIYVVIVPLQP